MSYTRHHCIVVTSWDKITIAIVHKKALEIFPNVSNMIKSEVNGYVSFLVPPDGSNEGWDISNDYDLKRANFITYLKIFGSVKFIEVQYADEDSYDKIVHKG